MTTQKIPKKLEKALSEYIDLLKQNEKIFPLTLSGKNEPKPTKYMTIWYANAIKLTSAEKKLICVFEEYKKVN